MGGCAAAAVAVAPCVCFGSLQRRATFGNLAIAVEQRTLLATSIT
jgi:hypothetical protein